MAQNTYKIIENGRKNSKFYEFSDGMKAVSSYNTLIAIYNNGVLYELKNSGCSPTTARHYQDFRRHYNISYASPVVVNPPAERVSSAHPDEYETWDKLGNKGELACDLPDLARGWIKLPKLTY